MPRRAVTIRFEFRSFRACSMHHIEPHHEFLYIRMLQDGTALPDMVV
jgi:hypothetical protein